MKTKTMLMVAGFAAVGLWALAVPRSAAQVDAVGANSDEELRGLLKESALDGAGERAVAERARMAAEKAASDPSLKAKLDEAVRRGGRPEASAEELAARERAEAALDRMREGLSDEAKARIAEADAADAAAAARTVPIQVTPPAVPVKPADFEDAQPTQPERVDITPKAVKNRVKVTAAGAAEFDSRTGIAIFTEDVVVEHPSFYLECDELEVHMSKEAAAEAKVEADGATPAPPPAVPGAEEGGPEKSGIDLAIAKGRRVVLKKNSEDGKLQIGICRYAVFDGATGDIEMRIWPQIQKGKELLKATSESTVIVIKQDGRMTTHSGGVALDANAKEVK